MVRLSSTQRALNRRRGVDDTTNAIQSVQAQLQKIIRPCGHFPSDDAAAKLFWRALRNIAADCGRPVKEWRAAMNLFAVA